MGTGPTCAFLWLTSFVDINIVQCTKSSLTLQYISMQSISSHFDGSLSCNQSNADAKWGC